MADTFSTGTPVIVTRYCGPPTPEGLERIHWTLYDTRTYREIDLSVADFRALVRAAQLILDGHVLPD